MYPDVVLTNVSKEVIAKHTLFLTFPRTEGRELYITLPHPITDALTIIITQADKPMHLMTRRFADEHPPMEMFSLLEQSIPEDHDPVLIYASTEGLEEWQVGTMGANGEGSVDGESDNEQLVQSETHKGWHRVPSTSNFFPASRWFRIIDLTESTSSDSDSSSSDQGRRGQEEEKAGEHEIDVE